MNYNKGGNNDIMPHNITMNNEQKKIGVYATRSENTYNQSHIYNSQKSGGGFNYINYKDQKKA